MFIGGSGVVLLTEMFVFVFVDVVFEIIGVLVAGCGFTVEIELLCGGVLFKL